MEITASSQRATSRRRWLEVHGATSVAPTCAMAMRLLVVVLDGAEYPPGARDSSNPLMGPAKNNGGQGGRQRAVFVRFTDAFSKHGETWDNTNYCCTPCIKSLSHT